VADREVPAFRKTIGLARNKEMRIIIRRSKFLMNSNIFFLFPNFTLKMHYDLVCLSLSLGLEDCTFGSREDKLCVVVIVRGGESLAELVRFYLEERPFVALSNVFWKWFCPVLRRRFTILPHVIVVMAPQSHSNTTLLTLYNLSLK